MSSFQRLSSRRVALSRRRILEGGMAVLTVMLGLDRWVGRPAKAADPMTQKWICTSSSCPGHIYDPQVGDPARRIPAGTPFEDLPDDWYCPDCGAAKIEYVPFD